MDRMLRDRKEIKCNRVGEDFSAASFHFLLTLFFHQNAGIFDILCLMGIYPSPPQISKQNKSRKIKGTLFLNDLYVHVLDSRKTNVTLMYVGKPRSVQ